MKLGLFMYLKKPDKTNEEESLMPKEKKKATATPTKPMLFGKGGLETTLHCEPFQCSIGAGRLALPFRPTVQTSALEVAETAKKRGVSEAELQRQLMPIRAKLLTARQQRKRPLTDTKIVSGWNGLMIRGYADAGRVWKNPDYLAAASKAAEFVFQRLRTPSGRLLRIYAGGDAKFFRDSLMVSAARRSKKTAQRN